MVSGKARVAGCLLPLAVALVIAAVVGTFVYWQVSRAYRAVREATKNLPVAGSVSSMIASSEVYQKAVAAAQSSPEVSERLGTPITADAANTKGTISTRGISGNADLIIPLSGPNNQGKLYATARKEDGVWKFYTLSVEIEGRLVKLPR